MRLPGIKWVSEQEGWIRGGTGRLFRKSRIWAGGKGVISLFWGSGFFFHDVMIFDFKFGSNRTAGSEDTIICVAAHGTHRTIPLLVVSDFRVSHVTSFPPYPPKKRATQGKTEQSRSKTTPSQTILLRLLLLHPLRGRLGPRLDLCLCRLRLGSRGLCLGSSSLPAGGGWGPPSPGGLAGCPLGGAGLGPRPVGPTAVGALNCHMWTVASSPHPAPLNEAPVVCRGGRLSRQRT